MRDVYEPAEDSRLLAETAIGYLDGDECVLDVGTGSGYVGGRIDAETDATVVASDLNPHAVRSAAAEGLAAVRASLLDPFQDDAFDAVVFNAPYLPTPPDREWDDWMERALSGGESGRAVIEPFLTTVGRVLRPGGLILLVVSSLTGIEEVTAFAADQGLAVRGTAAERSFPFETLSVLTITHGH